VSQFDVHRLKGANQLVVDCQAEILEELNTRLVIPLMPRGHAPAPAKRLNPTFVIDGIEHVLVTQFAAAIERRELGELVTSLRDESFAIIGAVDVLISGV